MSRNPEYLARLQKRGWSVYDLDDSLPQATFMREGSGDYWEKLHEQGYKVLYLDPKSGN